MSEIAIKVENLSKAYQLGEIGTGTLSRDLERWYAKVRGKEDPFLRIGETNDRTTKGKSDVVWSLKDINFEIEQGDAVGIIGRNGAGKSTLLKILSRVTSPTTGKISGKGRIASLLEVGTGFHPELTGRENIFLNGAILGMRKKEIAKKFDEIVDFSGVERYIDTPVKRYSSGMYVRLAFAVAAHLESEILIVDEVLAVGDAEFQKKCLGKMGEVSKGEGRTVLFVSHNMASVKSLTSKSILLSSGELLFEGRTEDIVEKYISINSTLHGKFQFKENLNQVAQFKNVCILNSNNEELDLVLSGTKIKFRFDIINNTNRVIENCSVGLGIFTATDNMLIAVKSDTLDVLYNLNTGLNFLYCEIDKFPLSAGKYKFNIILNQSTEILDWIKDAGVFEVENSNFFNTSKIPAIASSIVLIDHKWII